VNVTFSFPQLFALRSAAGLMRSRFLFLLSGLLIIAPTVWSESRSIDWTTLNLNPSQESQIEQLETGWKKTHQEVSGQIDKDQTEMKKILPSGDTQRIRLLQNRISTNKMYLMNESMDTFLKKRELLTPTQRNQLQKLLP